MRDVLHVLCLIQFDTTIPILVNMDTCELEISMVSATKWIFHFKFPHGLIKNLVTCSKSVIDMDPYQTMNPLLTLFGKDKETWIQWTDLETKVQQGTLQLFVPQQWSVAQTIS